MQTKTKVFLALGFQKLEDYLQEQLKETCTITGISTYRESVVKSLQENPSEIIILRETLMGKIGIFDLVYQVISENPGIRVIFIAKDRNPGDALLSELVGIGVFDIISGNSINTSDIKKLVLTPNKFSDVSHYRPKAIIDENKNTRIFESPTVVVSQNEHKTIDNKINSSEEPIDVTSPISDSEAKSLEINKTKDSTALHSKLSKSKIKKISTSFSKTINKTIDKNPDNDLEELGYKNNSKYRTLSTENTALAKQKIITFMGTKSGVGTTQVAYNTAISLANKKFKVLFIEFNEKNSSVDELLNLGFSDIGIDIAAKNVKNNNFSDINKNIIGQSILAKLIKCKSPLSKAYSLLPTSLDFLFFSRVVANTRNHQISESELKELIVHLAFEEEYAFIIFDITNNAHSKLNHVILNLSSKIYFIITQDITTITASKYNFMSLSNWKVSYLNKLDFIVNKYEENTPVNSKLIEELLHYKPLMLIPYIPKEFTENNYNGVPVILKTNNKKYIRAINGIIEYTLYSHS